MMKLLSVICGIILLISLVRALKKDGSYSETMENKYILKICGVIYKQQCEGESGEFGDDSGKESDKMAGESDESHITSQTELLEIAKEYYTEKYRTQCKESI